MYSVLLVLGSGYGVLESYSGVIGYFVVHCVNEHSVPRGGSCHIDIYDQYQQVRNQKDMLIFLTYFFWALRCWSNTFEPAFLQGLSSWTWLFTVYSDGIRVQKVDPSPPFDFRLKLVANFAMRLSRSCTNALLFWAAPALLTLKYNHSQ